MSDNGSTTTTTTTNGVTTNKYEILENDNYFTVSTDAEGNVTSSKKILGRVDSIEVEKNSVTVVVSMFGRETPVEFELDMIEVVSQKTHRL